MSNFFTKEERILLDQYQSLNQINCSEFLLNFVKTNPLNYPVTSMILQKISRKSTIQKVKDMFDYITKNFEDDVVYDHNEILISTIKESLLHKTLTFINLVTGAIFSGLTNSIDLIRKNNQISFMILKGDDCYEVIDDSCSRIMIFNIKYYQDIITQFNKSEVVNMDTFKIAINKTIPEYYDFKLEVIGDIFIQRCIILSFLTGNILYKRYNDLDNEISSGLCRVMTSLDNYCTVGHLIKKQYVDNMFKVDNEIEGVSLITQVPDFEGSDLPAF